MKLFSLITLTCISLCAGLCCPEEDEIDYQQIDIDNDSIISIENNKNTFNVNDRIFINTTIKNEQLTQDNESVVLSDYLKSDESNNFYHTLVLFRETSFGTLSKIPLNEDNIEVTSGSVALNEAYIQITNLFNGDSYTSNFSIRLLETGTFYLANSTFDGNNIGRVYLYGSCYNNNSTININIISSIINSEANGAYKFTVSN